MGRRSYDAVIVGARVAGTPAATRLAEQGWKVLLVDREPPPADTLSTHALFPNTLARLAELGALERIEAEHRVNLVDYAIRTLGHEVAGLLGSGTEADPARGVVLESGEEIEGALGVRRRRPRLHRRPPAGAGEGAPAGRRDGLHVRLLARPAA